LTLFLLAWNSIVRILFSFSRNLGVLGGYMVILWWIIVGLIAGWITGKLMSGGGYGAIMDIVIGIIGAVIGGFIMRALGFAGQGGMIYTILVAIFGAVILTLIIRLFTRGRTT
jgi:uncharacterized membrane protein YeaQ/YmgE (transglycosylase-associated protein family)